MPAQLGGARYTRSCQIRLVKKRNKRFGVRLRREQTLKSKSITRPPISRPSNLHTIGPRNCRWYRPVLAATISIHGLCVATIEKPPIEHALKLPVVLLQRVEVPKSNRDRHACQNRHGYVSEVDLEYECM